MSSQQSVLQDAASALSQVLAEKGYHVTRQALYWMLGQAWGESYFGTSPDWTIPNDLNNSSNNPDAPNGPSYNWGAVRATGDAPYIWHKDQDANGNLNTYKFARNTSHKEGAQRYVGSLMGSTPVAVGKILSDESATPFDLARIIYTRNADPNVLDRSQFAYYTGTIGDDRTRIQAYANLITNGANHITSVLGEAPLKAYSRLRLWETHKTGIVFAAIGISFGLLAGALRARNAR